MLLLIIGLYALHRIPSSTRRTFDLVLIGQSTSSTEDIVICEDIDGSISHRLLQSVYVDLIYNECTTLHVSSGYIVGAHYTRNHYLYLSRDTGYGITPIIANTEHLEK